MSRNPAAFLSSSAGAAPAALAFAFATILGVVLSAGAHAGTPVSGAVSGVWDSSGSPYWVEGDLLVAGGNSLLIEPGVEVRFRGPFRFLVQGTLEASGSPSDSILFTRDLPEHTWRGIRFVAAAPASRLEYCRIEHVRSAENYPDVRGGAVYVESCSPSIRHCLMQHNVSRNANSNGMGGGVACVGASPVIEHCVIRVNTADSGGGIATIEEGTAVVRNNRIEENIAPYSGGGIYAGVRSSPVIENNVIRGNRAQGWGGGGVTLWNWYAMNHISKTVRNNIVEGNWTSTQGGGFYIRYDFSILENNTVVNNTATGNGGGVYVLNQGPGDFPPHLRNWILWGNTAAQGAGVHPDPSTGSVAYASYSDIQGGWSGVGNINTDPLFADDAFHLAHESPCIDAGDPGASWSDACFPPSLGTERNDMGAYGGPAACAWPEEVSGTPSFEPAPAGLLVDGARLDSCRPNPFHDATTISFQLGSPAEVRLEIIDPEGRLLRRLYNGSVAAGAHEVVWDGRRDSGLHAGAGMYFCRLYTQGRSETRPVILLRSGR